MKTKTKNIETKKVFFEKENSFKETCIKIITSCYEGGFNFFKMDCVVLFHAKYIHVERERYFHILYITLEKEKNVVMLFFTYFKYIVKFKLNTIAN